VNARFLDHLRRLLLVIRSDQVENPGQKFAMIIAPSKSLKAGQGTINGMLRPCRICRAHQTLLELCVEMLLVVLVLEWMREARIETRQRSMHDHA
jgi:hypothetical protein